MNCNPNHCFHIVREYRKYAYEIWFLVNPSGGPFDGLPSGLGDLHALLFVNVAQMDLDGVNGKKPKTGSFQALGLDREILNAVNRMNYKTPTPIQRKALPLALAGIDLVCMARTGSGKTCAFLLPTIQKLNKHSNSMGVRAIVLSPTRELAVQTFRFAKDIAKFTDLNIINILGGDPIEAQFEALASRPDLIVATPGRLMHHLREITTFKLNHVQMLVFDEADRLFEMGFAEQLNEIVRECPVERQTLLFSATMPKALVQFSRAGLRDPQLIRLDTDSQLSEELRLAFFTVRSNEKMAAFLYLVRKIIPENQITIVFSATRHHSELLHAMLERINVSSTIVYGTMDQDARSQHLKAFRNGSIRYLIVTDLAARGIDVPLLNNVINFHFPPSPKLFIHRCGRAARQGRIGYAFSLVEPEELAFMVDIHTYLGKNLDNCDTNLHALDTTDMFETSGAKSSADENEANNTSFNNASTEGKITYTLETMTPAMVHAGVMPQDVLDSENDYVKRCYNEDDALNTMFRISENGMKQYRRTRTEASRGGVKTAKAIVKNNLIRAIHPLIAGCDPRSCSADVVEKNKYVRMLQTFRPAQTVFETGIGTATGNTGSKVNGGAHPQQISQKTKLMKGTEMMKALREATHASLERNRKTVAQAQAAAREAGEGGEGEVDSDINDEGDSDDSQEDGSDDEEADFNGDGSDNENGDEVDEYDVDDEMSFTTARSSGLGLTSRRQSLAAARSATPSKVRLSITEKKKLKKKGLSQAEIREIALRKVANDKALASAGAVVSNAESTGNNNSSKSTGGAMSQGLSDTYRDKHYMAYGDEDATQSFAEEMLQPQSNLRSSESMNAMKMDRALLDISPDDAVDLNNKKRILRWDAKKRKFVKQTLQEMAENQKRGVKRMRTETGIISKKSALPQGEMYEKWKKRTHKEIGGNDPDAGTTRMGPNVKVNSKVRDELRSASEIRSLKAGKDNMKLKNMKKDKRGKVEAGMRKKRKANQETYGNKKVMHAGMSRRSKLVVRV